MLSSTLLLTFYLFITIYVTVEVRTHNDEEFSSCSTLPIGCMCDPTCCRHPAPGGSKVVCEAVSLRQFPPRLPDTTIALAFINVNFSSSGPQLYSSNFQHESFSQLRSITFDSTNIVYLDPFAFLRNATDADSPPAPLSKVDHLFLINNPSLRSLELPFIDLFSPCRTFRLKAWSVQSDALNCNGTDNDWLGWLLIDYEANPNYRFRGNFRGRSNGVSCSKPLLAKLTDVVKARGGRQIALPLCQSNSKHLNVSQGSLSLSYRKGSASLLKTFMSSTTPFMNLSDSQLSSTPSSFFAPSSSHLAPTASRTCKLIICDIWPILVSVIGLQVVLIAAILAKIYIGRRRTATLKRRQQIEQQRRQQEQRRCHIEGDENEDENDEEAAEGGGTPTSISLTATTATSTTTNQDNHQSSSKSRTALLFV